MTTGLHYFSRWERPTDETPIPNAWDRFVCACGSRWSRVDGEFYHRRRCGAVCDGPVEITYLNPPRTHVCNRLHSDELPKSQGTTRGNWFKNLIKRNT